MFTPPERGQLVYPCGCTYRTLNGFGVFPAASECAEHAVISEMASIVATEAHRISLGLDDD